MNGILLRCGYTTGTCAAAAAKAAAAALLSGSPVYRTDIRTPAGISLSLEIADIQQREDSVSCAVRKDAGDDPDATDGLFVYAKVGKAERGIQIDGGEGVGRVTKPGLDQPVGAAAINSTPRRMIAEAVQSVCDTYAYGGGLSVTISVPGGEAVARKTFNPRMGIEGGISIIGTSGIVEPMSSKALIDTIRLQIKQLAAEGSEDILLTSGNYGESFTSDKLGLSMESHILCSNFIGDAIDAAVENGFRNILLIGHIGKMVKLGIGVTNTHSANGDGRMETLAACAVQAGAELPLLRAVLDSVTTDSALAEISKAGLLQSIMEVLKNRIDACLSRRVPESVRIGFICFTNAPGISGILAQSENAPRLMARWRKRE